MTKPTPAQDLVDAAPAAGGPTDAPDGSDPNAGSWFRRVARGAGYVPRGLRFVLTRHPGLLAYCAIPALINTLFFGVTLALLGYFGGELKDWLFGLVAGDHHWLLEILVTVFRGLIWVIYVLACLLFSAGVVYLGGNLLASPFNDLLSEKVEERYTGQPAPRFTMKRFLRGLLLTVSEELKRLLFYVAVMAPLLLLHLIPVAGSILYMVVSAWFTFYFLTMEFLSLPMARRHYRFGQWLSTTRSNFALSTGFGAVATALLWVPLLNFVMIPLAVIGGTLLYCDLQAAGQLPPPPDLALQARKAPTGGADVARGGQ